ncbi:MAG TPA: AI-2E family transporter [Thermoanaerobaculia bacterium]|nr:AI-2E family transporter [Thermoanaerobaculia bacterium]
MKLSSANPVRFERRAFLVFAGVVFAAFLWWVLRPLLAPVLLAVLTAVIAQPLHERIGRRFPRWPWLATTLSLLTLTVLVGAPLAGLALLFVIQARDLIAEYLGQEEARNRLVEAIQQVIDWTSQLASSAVGDAVNVEELLRGTMRRLLTTAYEHLPDVVGVTGRLLLAALIFSVVLFMLLLKGRQLTDLFVEISPLGERHTRRILSRLEDTINGVFLGSLATALVQGTIGALGFWIVGFPNVLVLGALIAGAGLIPVVGTALIWVPAALSLFLAGHNGAGLAMVAVGAVVGTVDNLIKPVLIHERAEVHPVLVFIGLLGGLRTLGAMGLLYGPLIVACLTEMIRIYRDDFAAPPEPGLPEG